MGKAKGEASPHDVRCWSQENRGSATQTLGEGEESEAVAA
jgi:hypothetical protein